MTSLLLAAAAVFAGQFVKGVCGFGSSLVAMPVLVGVFGAREAVLVVASIDLVGGAALVAPVWRKVSALLLGCLFVPLTAGQYVGTGLLTTLPEDAVALVLGSVTTVLGLDVLVRPVRTGRGEWEALPEQKGRLLFWGSLAGLAGGVMAGLVAAGGPPLALFMRHYFRETFFRANLLALWLCGSATLLLMLVARGAATRQGFEHAAILMMPMLMGAWSGTAMAGRLSRVAFGRAVGAVLVAAGVALVVAHG